jgi:GTPase SAR1 family protein
MTANVTGYEDETPKPKMRNLAIVGGFAAGKTTLSEGLVQQGYTRVSFARYLKEICAVVYNGGKAIEKWQEFEVHSLDGEARTITGRRMLQEFGQSVKVMDRDFWVKSLVQDVTSGKYGPGPFVTDDCRFPYEADALRRLGFEIVKLETPLDTRIRRYFQTYGVYPTAEELVHPSEIELVDIEYDHEIDGEKDPKAILEWAYNIGRGVPYPMVDDKMRSYYIREDRKRRE